MARTNAKFLIAAAVVAGAIAFTIVQYQTHAGRELSKDSWVNAGFSSPGAVLQTRAWAVLHGDREAFKQSLFITDDARKFATDTLVQMTEASLAPDKDRVIQDIRKGDYSVEEGILMPLMAANQKNTFVGCKILSQHSSAADKMTLEVETDRTGAAPLIETLNFQRFGHDWKIVLDKNTIQKMMGH